MAAPELDVGSSSLEGQQQFSGAACLVLGAGISANARLLLVFGVSFLVAVPYVKGVLSRASPGLPRLLLCLPLLAFNLAAPLLFDMHGEIMGRLVMIFILSWLANFKLLAYCVNRGPLHGAWSATQISLILLHPIYPTARGLMKPGVPLKGRMSDNGGKSHSMLGRAITKLAFLFATVTFLQTSYADLTHPLVIDLLHAFALYFFLGFMMDGPASALSHLTEIDIIPTFDQPWMSTSLADFWGRRWNITTSHMLRALIYEPVTEGRLLSGTGHKWRRASAISRMIGMCATFLVSGIVHEIILWAIQPDGKWGWKWLVFFTIQGPLIIVERYAMRWASKRGLSLGPWASRALTCSFLLVVGHYLWFAPTNVDTDTMARAIRACAGGFEAMIGSVRGLLVAGGASA